MTPACVAPLITRRKYSPSRGGQAAGTPGGRRGTQVLHTRRPFSAQGHRLDAASAAGNMGGEEPGDISGYVRARVCV